MTKKAEKLDLDNLINTINHSSEFFILAKEGLSRNKCGLVKVVV